MKKVVEKGGGAEKHLAGIQKAPYYYLTSSNLYATELYVLVKWEEYGLHFIAIYRVLLQIKHLSVLTQVKDVLSIRLMKKGSKS